MSQPAGTEPPAGGGGNLLTRKVGGVPGWAWITIVAAGVGGIIWWRARKSSAAAAVSPGAAAGSTQATCYDANGATVECSDPSAVGSNATDYFEALYAQGEGINSQLENITPQVTDTGNDVDTILRNTTPSHPAPKPKPGMVTIPNVVGKRAAFGIDQMHALGLQVHTSPLRRGHEYVITATSPKAGTRVPRGSSVTLDVRELTKPKAA